MASAPLMLTAAVIATATGGTVVSGDPQTPVNGFSIDSRTLQPGDLFFAIVAARDGHEFVGTAFAKGAAAVVVHETAASHLTAAGPGAGPGAHDRSRCIINVADTTQALQDLGRFVRREAGATVIAITGSAGKTTTKETIAEFLSTKYRVTKNKGNLNNHLGLPLSLLELRHGADVAVMELGMNHAGEIRMLVNIAEPDVRVWTNVGDAHLGYFASRDEIADAKGEILEDARPGDVLICNADDPLVMARASRFAGRRLTFGATRGADVYADAIEDLGLEGTRLMLHTPRGSAAVHTPLLGRGNVSNLLAAAAVAVHFGIAVDAIAATAATLQPAAHRGAVIQLGSGIIVIDDSYNSSPTALKRALDVIAAEREARRKAAVLGEMLELGAHAEQLHRECGQAAAAAKLDRLVAVGGDAAKALADAAIASGMDEEAVTHTASSSAAADVILSWLKEDGATSSPSRTLVLVKGSRGINTDLVVDHILEEFS
jgi:UDP-N-acetylmuramoyl-tripeptide--D-alanyl-D-alanine ligase